MSDFILTGSIVADNINSPKKIPLDSSANIVVTLTHVGTIAFPVTLSAQVPVERADIIDWTQIIPPTVLPGPGVSFTTTATVSSVAQPLTNINQNYLVTVIDSTGRTQSLNLALGNNPIMYPSATLDVPVNYPDPLAFGTPPSPPNNLIATPFSASQINLSWLPPLFSSAPILGYQIERQTPTGGLFYILVANTGTTAIVYSDTGLGALTSYTYRVSAINIIGVSDPSNNATAVTL